jgi:uncharacterized MnhB-related membrane protein
MDQGYPLFYTFHFYLFGILAVASALLFVTRKSPIAAALWLVSTMFSLAAMYVMLDAQFIGAIQVLVYAGAIMVVFLFVIMLLNLGRPEEIADVRGFGWRLGSLSGVLRGFGQVGSICWPVTSCRRRLGNGSRRPMPSRPCRRGGTPCSAPRSSILFRACSWITTCL